MMATMVDTATAAKELGISRRSVQNLCKQLGIAKVGRDYLLTPRQLERIRKVARTGPGRPRKE